MYSVTSGRKRQRESGRDRESLAETKRVWLEVRESLAETETQRVWQRQRLRESGRGRGRDSDKRNAYTLCTVPTILQNCIEQNLQIRMEFDDL